MLEFLESSLLALVAFALEASKWLTLQITRWVPWDPLAYTLRRVAITGEYRDFLVAGASTYPKHCLIAWFYHWHPAPDSDAWRRFAARYLDDPSNLSHRLQFRRRDDKEDPFGYKIVIHVSLDLDRGVRLLYCDCASVSLRDPTLIGSLCPAVIARDVHAVARGERPPYVSDDGHELVEAVRGRVSAIRARYQTQSDPPRLTRTVSSQALPTFADLD